MDRDSEWNPDMDLIQSFLEDLKSRGVDLEKKTLYVPNGTQKGHQRISHKELADEMREGTKFGRAFYDSLRDLSARRGDYTPRSRA